MQVEIGKLVVNIAVEYNDIAFYAGTCPPFSQYNQAETERVQQIEEVPCQGKVPTAHVFVAPVYRASRRADRALTLVYGVNKTFTVLYREDHVIPESEPPGSQACFVERSTQALNLCGLSRAIYTREADQQRLMPFFLRRRSLHGSCLRYSLSSLSYSAWAICSRRRG